VREQDNAGKAKAGAKHSEDGPPAHNLSDHPIAPATLTRLISTYWSGSEVRIVRFDSVRASRMAMMRVPWLAT
jgi:hypothetical protein